MTYFVVFVGAGIGGALRHAVYLWMPRLLGTESFPFDTLAINVVGSFLMGVIAEYFVVRTGLRQHLRLFLTTGILGGFTTFSSFSLDAVHLWQHGKILAAAIYVIASVVLSIGGLMVGFALVRKSLRPPAGEKRV
jgi:CrcB protein